jgi:ABC-type transporter Mla MlaB component
VTIKLADAKAIVMKIEGKISGLQVPELQRAWQDLGPSLSDRRLLVDLCGVTHVDGAGQTLLAEIRSKTGAEFVADTPLTRYFAEKATGNRKIRNRIDKIRRQS